MRQKILFSYETPFSGEHNIYGYIYGAGSYSEPMEAEKSAAIVGAMRGNEHQQLYICSKLSARLAMLEEAGDIVSGKSIMVVPSVNYSALNASHKYWLSDDSDINREFPGNPEGPATSRLAYYLLETLKDYTYGVQFPSFYMRGRFIPHIRMMKTGNESTNLANLFGLPFVTLNDLRPFDKCTLNYNWCEAGTEAFSLYSGGTSRINEEYAEVAVSAVLRFLSRMGVIRYNSMGGNISTVIDEDEMVSIKSEAAGFFRRLKNVNQEIRRGDVIGEIIDPMDGHILSEVKSPCEGIIFYMQDAPLIYQNVILSRVIKKVHK
ncbi:MAG: succinylglutamate desuccinylase/aspartoacylase family protein [Eubacterium sp.]|jgi:predicted deacylase|nr:succinylglutamate desuccinylase/aspartoacylase family protein [Eubacterium sp.]